MTWSQDCLASLRLADNCPVNLGKWKVLPRQVLFLLESIPSGVRREEYIFYFQKKFVAIRQFFKPIIIIYVIIDKDYKKDPYQHSKIVKL